MRFANAPLKRCRRPLQTLWVGEPPTHSVCTWGRDAAVIFDALNGADHSNARNLMMSERDYFCGNPFFCGKSCRVHLNQCPSSESFVFLKVFVLFIYPGGLFGVAAVRLRAASSVAVPLRETLTDWNQLLHSCFIITEVIISCLAASWLVAFNHIHIGLGVHSRTRLRKLCRFLHACVTAPCVLSSFCIVPLTTWMLMNEFVKRVDLTPFSTHFLQLNLSALWFKCLFT